VNKFHHIGIFVKDLDYGRSEMSKFIQVSQESEIIIDENLGVKILFLTDQENINYELVAPYGKNNPVDGVISREKDLLNHIAYVSDSFDEEIKVLRRNGFVPLGKPKKAKAFKDARVIFFLNPLGFIIEIIEDLEK
jgi:methylmalonyl-CoA/ethylmalonyl-CoA epimerase